MYIFGTTVAIPALYFKERNKGQVSHSLVFVTGHPCSSKDLPFESALILPLDTENAYSEESVVCLSAMDTDIASFFFFSLLFLK